jgi:hypothetical protein
LQFSVKPSPSPEVLLTRYDETLFPKFRQVFAAQSPIGRFGPKSEESEIALVLENRSDRAITALRYRWVFVAADGKVRPTTCSSDSYSTLYRPVLDAGDRKLITPSATVTESLLDHIASGGGVIGGGSSRSHADFVELTFSIDLIVFADGEIAGPDPDRFAGELNCRKPAAEFIAQQIRLADAESRDVTPVLAALAEAPCLHGDFLAEWTRRYASDFLRRSKLKIGDADMRESALRYLENRPTLPKFYRRQQPEN